MNNFLVQSCGKFPGRNRAEKVVLCALSIVWGHFQKIFNAFLNLNGGLSVRIPKREINNPCCDCPGIGLHC